MHASGGSGASPRLYALLTSNRIRYYGRHHGALSTAMFRLGVAAGQAARFWRGSPHRAALFSALMPLRPVSEFQANTRT